MKKKSWSSIADLFCNFWNTGRPFTGHVGHLLGSSTIYGEGCPFSGQVGHLLGRSAIYGAGRRIAEWIQDRMNPIQNRGFIQLIWSWAPRSFNETNAKANATINARITLT